MKIIIVNATGQTIGDVLLGLRRACEQIEAGMLVGAEGNAHGDYYFEVNDKEDNDVQLNDGSARTDQEVAAE